MLVKDLMTKEVITVKPTAGIHELAELFIKKNISGAPVVDDAGKVVGIVQEEGIMFQDKKVHLPSFVNISLGFLTLGVKRLEEEIKKVTASNAADIMEKNVVSITSVMTIEDVATMMIEKKVYYLLVIEDGKLVGVVTKRDIVRAIAKDTA